MGQLDELVNVKAKNEKQTSEFLIEDDAGRAAATDDS